MPKPSVGVERAEVWCDSGGDVFVTLTDPRLKTPSHQLLLPVSRRAVRTRRRCWACSIGRPGHFSAPKTGATATVRRSSR